MELRSSDRKLKPPPPDLSRHQEWAIAPGQRDAVHDAAEAMIIVDWVVKRTAVVPKRGRAGLPVEATGELGSHRMREQILEQRRALRIGHADEAQRVAAVHVQSLAT